MRPLAPHGRSQPSRLVALAAMATALVAAVIVVGAPQDKPSPLAVPSDQVVRDLVEIQQQLGGSIVEGTALETLAPATPPVSMSPSPVSTLREAAWQLDQSAYQLELVDLYDRADSLREMADELRQEARDLKGGSKKPE